MEIILFSGTNLWLCCSFSLESLCSVQINPIHPQWPTLATTTFSGNFTQSSLHAFSKDLLQLFHDAHPIVDWGKELHFSHLSIFHASDNVQPIWGALFTLAESISFDTITGKWLCCVGNYTRNCFILNGIPISIQPGQDLGNFIYLFAIKHKGGNRMRNDSWLLPLLGGLGQSIWTLGEKRRRDVYWPISLYSTKVHNIKTIPVFPEWIRISREMFQIILKIISFESDGPHCKLSQNSQKNGWTMWENIRN